VFGHSLTYLLVILPVGWLAMKALFSNAPVIKRAPVAVVDVVNVVNVSSTKRFAQNL
jgi:hypothetical protein